MLSCSGLCPIAVASALLSWAPPCCHVAESLCYGGLPWQRQAVSAMGVYLRRGRISSVMANTPPPPSCTVLGSVVLAVRLSTLSISSCRFVCPCAGETRRARSPGSLPQSAFLFFFKLNGRLSLRSFSRLLLEHQDLCDFLCS